MPGKRQRKLNSIRATLKEAIIQTFCILGELHITDEKFSQRNQETIDLFAKDAYLLFESSNGSAGSLRFTVKDQKTGDSGIYLWFWKTDGESILALVGHNDHKDDLLQWQSQIRSKYAGTHVRFEARRPADPDSFRSPAGEAGERHYLPKTSH